jgi:hypothetical protein
MKGLLLVYSSMLGLLAVVANAEDGSWYETGFAKQLSQQGDIRAIVPSVLDSATAWEISECKKERIDEGTVRQYLALAEEGDAIGHDYSSYPCKFLITIRYDEKDWVLDLNVSGLGYLKGPQGEWHTIGCGRTCSHFMPNAAKDGELCEEEHDAC